MPRPMLRKPEQQLHTADILSTTNNQENRQEAQQMDKMKLDRMLRKTRSKEYMEALHSLDAGGHVHNKNQVDEIMNTIKNEFPEVDIAGILLGFVSICYLGAPYEVHTLDVSGNIIEHYKIGHPLPGGLEKARGIALKGGYEFIEVYVDCLRAVNSSGTVSVIPC